MGALKPLPYILDVGPESSEGFPFAKDADAAEDTEEITEFDSVILSVLPILLPAILPALNGLMLESRSVPKELANEKALPTILNIQGLVRVALENTVPVPVELIVPAVLDAPVEPPAVLDMPVELSMNVAFLPNTT